MSQTHLLEETDKMYAAPKIESVRPVEAVLTWGGKPSIFAGKKKKKKFGGGGSGCFSC